MLEIFEFIQKHWVIVAAIAGSVWTYFWLTMDSKYAKKSDVAALVESIKGNDKRLTGLETRLENLPTSEDLASIQILMTEIKGETKSTHTQVQAISHQVALLLEAKVLNKE
ncbi:DUF2730 domain-containing protein [Rodentibacter abscessus]|uniref:DUF2730 domain-containing protein n=1 Tax=Rodentibacter abscessus TaxID=3381777 RepID=UPI00399C78C2